LGEVPCIEETAKAPKQARPPDPQKIREEVGDELVGEVSVYDGSAVDLGKYGVLEFGSRPASG
jgi:hypothetical protein